MFRTLAFASLAGLFAASAAPAADTHVNYDKQASAKAASNLAQDTAALAPQVPQDQALDPQGPTTVASKPVPDTPENRAAYGQPLSHSGKRTAPIGD